LPSELDRLSPAICKGWFREFVTPRNAHLSLVGDLASANSRGAIERHFARWSGPEVRGFNPSVPEGLSHFEIFVVDRPSSTQSDIFLALLGPNRREPSFPMAAIAQQIVGGGVAGRLFLDVREKRSLAYSTGAGIQELAAGPSVLYFAAGTQTSKTSETVGALLEHLDRMGSGQIDQGELELAQRFLVDSMPIRWEQVQTLAAQLAQLRILALPNDYYDAFRDQLMHASVANIAEFTASLYRRDRAVMVLAGDSKVVAPELTKYATVSIVEPSQGFRLRGQLPRTAGQ
jgi:zinc protease